MPSPPERAAATRARLLLEARALFAARGFAETSTDAILEMAGVKRGALYHHFADKAALFEAVCDLVAGEVAAAVDAAATGADQPLEALRAGARAWIATMARPDVRRILAVDAPTVLGLVRYDALDRRHAQTLLAEGLAAAMDAGAIDFPPGPDRLAALLSGAFNAAALRLGAGSDAGETEAWINAVLALIDRLTPDPGRN
jgi:AcrR family transcriptional regulator